MTPIILPPGVAGYKPPEYAIELMKPEWVDACAGIAATAPDPWRRENLAKTIGDDSHPCFVVHVDDTPLGFAAFTIVADSADLEMIAVHPEVRRRGAAKALLVHALSAVAQKGARRVFLEARASNEGALALYRELSFATLARRPGMYRRPTEDGILMARNVGEGLN